MIFVNLVAAIFVTRILRSTSLVACGSADYYPGTVEIRLRFQIGSDTERTGSAHNAVS